MSYQPMPELTPAEYQALRANIQTRGILVPILVDQTGAIIDGNNRAAIAVELGIECPREVREVSSADEALDLAVELNCSRRHLSQEQKRQVIAAEIARRPGDSDRAIARRVGCSPTTVGAIRNPPPAVQSGHPDGQLTHDEARRLTDEIRGILKDTLDSYAQVCVSALSVGCSPMEVLGSVTAARRDTELRATAEGAPGVFSAFDAGVFRPLSDWLLDDDAMSLTMRHALTAPVETRREILGLIRQGGAVTT